MNVAGFVRIMSVGNSGNCSLSSGRVLPWKLYIGKYFGPLTGMAGIIVDGRGKWISGFMGLTHYSFFSLKAELQALFLGLVDLNDLIDGKEEDYKKTEIYLPQAARDAMRVLNNERYAHNIFYSQSCALWKKCDCVLGPDLPSSVYTEHAEWMAKRAVLDDISQAVLHVPPIEIQHFFDIGGELLQVPYNEIRNLFDQLE